VNVQEPGTETPPVPVAAQDAASATLVNERSASRVHNRSEQSLSRALQGDGLRCRSRVQSIVGEHRLTFETADSRRRKGEAQVAACACCQRQRGCAVGGHAGPWNLFEIGGDT